MLEILLADDEVTIRMSVEHVLTAAGHRVTTASDGGAAMSILASRRFDLVITDVRMPKVDGLTVFRAIRRDCPTTDVILITAFGTVSDAVAAMKEGAYDYVTKPFDTDEIRLLVDRVAERHTLRRELEQARAQLAAQDAGSVIVGRSQVMARLVDRIETIADSDASVLITGESGTGKELVARTLHDRSRRHSKPFVAVNCAAFPETLLEAELFGHERGAFTGAVRRREGRFKSADGGTLFLDEIAEIPLPAQAKLLRVLQENTVEPLGTNVAVKVDVRIISATHRELRDRIADNRFREDLYYRLNVLDIAIPPLRDRRGDLPILIEHFLRRFVGKGGTPPAISPRAWAALSQYPFPGNVRELQHAMEHAVVLARGKEIDLEHLPRDIAGTTETSPQGEPTLRPLAVALKEFEREYLLRALTTTSGKKTRAAEVLGISRKNLWEKLRDHDVADSDLDE